MYRLLRLELYTILFVLVFPLSVGIAAAGMTNDGAGTRSSTAWPTTPCPLCAPEREASPLRISGPAVVPAGDQVEFEAILNEAPAPAPSWRWYTPPDTVEISQDGPTLVVQGLKASRRLGDVQIIATVQLGPGPPVQVVKSVTVAEVRIEAASGQIGSTGDFVRSVLDRKETPAREGLRHFVSPRRPGEEILFKARVSPAGVPLDAAFAWNGGQHGERPLLRAVDRGDPGPIDLTLKSRFSGRVLDEMRVWVISADIKRVRMSGATLEAGLVRPSGGELQEGYLVTSSWRFVARLEPQEMFLATKAADVPDLAGPKTTPVPEAGLRHITSGEYMHESANYKWDMSRQMRIRAHSPGLEPTDYDGTTSGDIYENIRAGGGMLIDYPGGEAEGNDDVGTGDEDNNPYSDAEIAPGTKTTTPLGWLAASDRPRAPVWINDTGTGDRIEWRLQFREFVRVQIGEKWYRVSDFADGEWQHVARAVKTNDRWIDGGSFAATGNRGFDSPF